MAKTVKCPRKGCEKEFKVGLVGSLVGHRKLCKTCRVDLVDPGVRVKGGVGEMRFAPWHKPDRRHVTNSMLGNRPQSAAERKRAAVMHGLANNPNFQVRPGDFEQPDMTIQLDPDSGTAEVNFGPDFGFLDAHRGRVGRARFAADRGLGPAPEIDETELLGSSYDFDGGVIDSEVLNTTYL
ncbi:hypothetical protein ACG83_10490 [Frankia sp. R43]|uniref:hypothetical protein n=1 Tax=Frankia sp. R43 TaxID=269536 RepID=UPI0006CA29D2|nr:hypothetical protein [Frankia sp. R43]KPM55702.1 hypothetical protein ACG83_10490 [Frankia sp. R43]